MKKTFALWLAAITLIGALLRIAGLNRGLWWDEIYMLVVSIRRPLAEIVTIFPGDNQHPLYSILARLSFIAFGEHVWTLRLPAFLFGVAAIPALYLLASSVAPRIEALIASAFLAVSYHHVWFSQNARGYSGLALFAILTTYFLLRGFQTGLRAPYIAYAFAGALGVYTHLTFAFLLVAQAAIMGAVALSDWRKGAVSSRDMGRWKYALQGAGLTIVLALLFYSPILMQMRHYFDHKSPLQNLSTPSWAMRELFRGLVLGLGTWVALAGAALFALCGLWSYFRQSRLVAALLVLPAAFMGAGTLLAGRTMYPRFYFLLIGFGVMILIRGLFFISSWFGERAQMPVAAVLSGLLLAASCFSLVRNYRYPKQDFVGAMQFLETATQPGDSILTAGATVYPYHEYFQKSWDSVETPEKLQNICLRGGAVWVVYTFPRYLQANTPGVMQMIHEKFHTVKVFPGTIGDGDVFVARYSQSQ